MILMAFAVQLEASMHKYRFYKKKTKIIIKKQKKKKNKKLIQNKKS